MPVWLESCPLSGCKLIPETKPTEEYMAGEFIDLRGEEITIIFAKLT